MSRHNRPRRQTIHRRRKGGGPRNLRAIQPILTASVLADPPSRTPDPAPASPRHARSHARLSPDQLSALDRALATQRRVDMIVAENWKDAL